MTKIPKLRFKEFEGEWEEKKLGDITYKSSRKNSEGKEYPIYSINNKRGFLPQSEQFEGLDSNLRGYDIKLYKIVDKNTFAYNPARINVGSLGYSDELENIIISSLYVCFKTNSSIEDIFLKQFFLTSRFNSQVLNNTEGSIRSYLFYDNFSKIILKVPVLEEQEKIALFLSVLDEKIGLEEDKLKSLKLYKKGLMQKIFNRELRFKDENGQDYPDWEEKRLGDECFIVMGQSPSSEFYNDKNEGLPLIQGNADIKGRKTNPRIYTKEITKTCNVGDIIMSVRAPVGHISKSIHYGCIGRGVCSIAPIYNSEYIYQFLLNFEKFWSKISQGSTFDSISKNDIVEIKLCRPNLKEQQKVGNFLSSVDNKIEKQEQKLQKLKLYKRGLLSQMFV